MEPQLRREADAAIAFVPSLSGCASPPDPSGETVQHGVALDEETLATVGPRDARYGGSQDRMARKNGPRRIGLHHVGRRTPGDQHDE